MSNSFPKPHLISFVPLHGLSQPVGWPGLPWGRGKSHNWVLWASPLPWGQQQLERGPALWGNNGASQLWVRKGWTARPNLAWVQKATLAPEGSTPLEQRSERSRESGKEIPLAPLMTVINCAWNPRILLHRTSGPMESMKLLHCTDGKTKGSKGLELSLSYTVS